MSVCLITNECTKKINRIKRGTQKRRRNRSLKRYSTDSSEKALGRLDFLDCQSSETINHVYSNFT